jgi:hypothetical protein
MTNEADYLYTIPGIQQFHLLLLTEGDSPTH